MLVHHLYQELLFVSAILLFILFINNIFLYKQKISDLISMMLVMGIVVTWFEIIWAICDVSESSFKSTFTLVAIYGFCISFVLFSELLNRYLLQRFGLRPGKVAITFFYRLPIALFILGTVSSPWTHLLAWAGEDGTIQYGFFYDIIFFLIVLTYLLSPAFIAIFLLTIGKHRRPEGGEISPSLFVFSGGVVVLYYLGVLLLGTEGIDYQALSLPVSLSLVYLVTNVSTHTVLETQAHVEAVETDLRIASRIQADALPPVAPEFAEHLELNLRGSMNTAKEVGGDFYDYFAIDENRICFLIADVSGKGTPAALFMMTAKTMIKDYTLTQGSTSQIFNAVNERLCENNEAGMFATAWIGIVDTRTMTLQYTNAGHNYPFFQRRDGSCEMIKDRHGLFLAGMEFTRYKQSEIQLEPGDRLLLYTDGVTEAHDRANNLYGEERLQSVMERTKDLPGEKVLEQITDDVNDFAMGVPQFDDITMIVLTIKE